MSLEININNAIKEAMKNKDQQSLTPLRAIKTALLMQKTQRVLIKPSQMKMK